MGKSTASNPIAVDQQIEYDVMIVGGGISGLVFLKYARDRGLRCLALEKESDIGGLWSRLPSWQDIQNKLSDFALNGIELKGATQPHVHQFVREWVHEYGLRPHIRTECEVTSVSRVSGAWRVSTAPGNEYVARSLVVASGAQNRPFVPDVKRTTPTIIEKHSSEIMDPAILTGRTVTVVGGGTSGWDLLDQALKHEAKEIHWVYRSIKWSLPTRASKQSAWPNIREMAVLQSAIGSIEGLNRFLRRLLRAKFRLLGLNEIKPEEQFDQRKHQLIPSRALMIENIGRIRRHRGVVEEIDGKRVLTTSDGWVETDVLAWSTGYRMDLSYLDLPEYRDMDRVDHLFPRLGHLMKSLDYPDMYFVGMPLLGSTSATPFFGAVESKTIVAHILGECRIPDEPIPHHLNHWDLLKYFSRFDRSNYPRYGARLKQFLRALFYVIFQGRSVRV